MRVADFIFQFLADHGITHVFVVTGGGAMYLNDALGREKRIHYVCNLHEQACAMGAEGYARISGLPGIVSVTTGPGGTNAITGVMGAWVDSVPMIVISGQVKESTMMTSCPELKLRSLGDQEINITDIVRPVTKYCEVVREPKKILFHMEKAWYTARHRRPGPVWLDVPQNIQAAEVPEGELEHFTPAEPDFPQIPSEKFTALCAALRNCSRPCIVAGYGVRLSGAEKELLAFAELYRIPVLTAISGADLIPSDHHLFFGRPGILGARAANFIMQNADLMFVIGTRMSLRVIGFNYPMTGRAAYKVMADIDPAELEKPTFCPDLKICTDAKQLLSRLIQEKPSDLLGREEWLEYCGRLRSKYPVVLQKHRDIRNYVSSYFLPEYVAELCRGDEIVVTGNGTAYTSTYQSFSLKAGMRMFANVACASMGYGLPAAIGAALAGKGRNVLCFTGDGSLQMNIQELQTLINEKLNVKLFVYNNQGYLSIKLTQKTYFGGHFMGSEPGSGIILPDLKKVAFAYGLCYCKLRNHDDVRSHLSEIMAAEGPALIEVMTDPLEELNPKAASWKKTDGSMESAPLEDLAPFLPQKEFVENMLIEPVGRRAESVERIPKE